MKVHDGDDHDSVRIVPENQGIRESRYELAANA